MKVYADFKLKSGEYKRITIWNVYRSYMNHKNRTAYEYDIKQFYKDYIKGKIYSTHREKKKKMSLNIKSPYSKSYFKYYPGQSAHSTEETLPHELFKDIVSGLSKIILKDRGNYIVLYILESNIEYEFKANGNTYYADVYFKFYKSEPEEYYYKWNGELCFEIKHSHAVDEKKRIDCLKEGIAIFEHTISAEHINMLNTIIDEQSENEVINSITENLKICIYGELISNPNSTAYLKIMKLQEEILGLNIKIDEQKQAIDEIVKAKKDMEDNTKMILSENNELKLFKTSVQDKRFLKMILKLYGIE